MYKLPCQVVCTFPIYELNRRAVFIFSSFCLKSEHPFRTTVQIHMSLCRSIRASWLIPPCSCVSTVCTRYLKGPYCNGDETKREFYLSMSILTRGINVTGKFWFWTINCENREWVLKLYGDNKQLPTVPSYLHILQSMLQCLWNWSVFNYTIHWSITV
jgi:hypothetical protein